MLPEQSLRGAPAVDWVSVGEFDYTCVDVASGKPLAEIDGLAYRENGSIVHTPERPIIMDMDAFPSVLDIYRRDSDDPQLFQRLPAASVPFVLHRTRLQVRSARSASGRRRSAGTSIASAASTASRRR